MPELPEMQGLADFLAQRLVGRVVEALTVASFSALKTVAPAPADLAGGTVEGVRRRGKWLDVAVTALPGAPVPEVHLLVHLGLGGWIRWSDELPPGPVPRGRRPRVLARLRTTEGSGLDLTEAGTHQLVAVHVVTDPHQVPAVADLGVDPLSPELTVEAFADLLRGRRQQLKGLLRDQRLLAGVGNAWSDEVLHAARLSPFALSGSLDDDAVQRLHGALTSVLADAVDRARGRPVDELKDGKRAAMRVHGRTGEPCPVCGDTVREVSFASSSLQYCPTCQTGGAPLADRRTSRFLR